MRRDEHTREPNPESGLTIRLFGGMAIQDSRGVNYLPRSRKTRAIVAMLTMTAPRLTQRTQLTALLWSKRENEQAHASLRQAVHELQGTLGFTWSRILLAERHTLSMNLGGVSVDALIATGPTGTSTALLALFQDGFLEDLHGLDPSFDVWLSKERLRLVAIARLAGEAYFQDPHLAVEIIAAARALLRIDPSHDGAWRALINAHLEANDRAAARFACEQWRVAMGSAPDEVPKAEMAVFLSRIRDGGREYPANVTAGGTPPDIAAPADEAGTPAGGASTYDPIGERSRTVPRRSSLRLGIREMRVIGPNVDQALSVGLAEEITTALSRFRWIS